MISNLNKRQQYNEPKSKNHIQFNDTNDHLLRILHHSLK